jgi:succinate dehydrogenase / fumarate reductase iron-sulfur subunit
MQAKFRVKRFSPEADNRSWWQEYDLSVPEGATVLEGLIKIKEEQDGTLAFRRACRSAICGSCAVRINGRAKLACKTQIRSQLKRDGVLTIEPLQNMAVIKDLVVDMEPFWQRLERVQPWLTPAVFNPDPDREFIQHKEEVDRYKGAATCIMCANCYSDCTVLEVDENFLGPAALAKSFRFAADTRDGIARRRLRGDSDEAGIWKCVRCEACVEACPKDVSPMDRIVALRSAAIAEDFTDNDGARHAEYFLRSTRATGRLNETLLPLATAGYSPNRILGMAPTGIRLALKGKLPFPIQRPIPGIDEIRRIMELVEQEPEVESK